MRINIAKDFTPNPIGRTPDDGEYSGEAFRENFLVPALNGSDEIIEICLDDVNTIGSSFLDEAFAGLVRIGFTSNELQSRLQFIHAEQFMKFYVERIWQYIQDEAN